MAQKFANMLHVVWFGAVIYLWNTKGRYHFNYDTLSVALTSLEVVLVVGGIFGFTYFRYISEKQAREVAKGVAESEARIEARRASTEWLQSQGIDWQKVAAIAPSLDGISEQAFADNLGDDEGK